MFKLKSLLLSIVIIINFLIPAHSQILGTFSEFVPGDKLTYSVKAEGKTVEYIFTFTEVNSAQSKGIASIAGKTMEFQSPAHGILAREFSLAGGFFETEWNPPVKIFDKNSKIGDRWQIITDIEVKDMANVREELESKVEKYEKIKIAAGEFDALRVYTTGSIKSKLKANSVTYPGSLTMTTWFGMANNRLVMLKREYKNTFWNVFSQELAKLPELGN